MLKAVPGSREEEKWNSPSFCIREHFATMQLRKADAVQLVLHTGAKKRPEILPLAIEDPAGLMKWLGKDRGVITLRSVDEVKKHQKALEALVREWAKYAG